MSDFASGPRHGTEEAEIALEVELDAKPETVWRAVAVPAFRERWLPAGGPRGAGADRLHSRRRDPLSFFFFFFFFFIFYTGSSGRTALRSRKHRRRFRDRAGA